MQFMESMNLEVLCSTLKSQTPADGHAAIEEVFARWSTARPAADMQAAYMQLSGICGQSVVENAIETVRGGANYLQHPPQQSHQQQQAQHVVVKPDETESPCGTLRQTDDESDYEGDVDGHEDTDGFILNTPRGGGGPHLEVCSQSFAAWNHCVNCSDLQCSFPLCKRVRPYVEHLREVKSKGIVGICRESCKLCAFYENMKRRVVQPEELNASPRKRKEIQKKKRLVVQFAGLLLAHKQDGGDPDIRSLFDHTMSCLETKCTYRGPKGSCLSSRKLLQHLQDCKPANTKNCELCSQLPPKIRRMKKAPRSLPVPIYVREAIKEERRERQKEKRRQRNALKRLTANGGAKSTGMDYGSDVSFDSNRMPQFSPAPLMTFEPSAQDFTSPHPNASPRMNEEASQLERMSLEPHSAQPKRRGDDPMDISCTKRPKQAW
mmetsp:Transcript_12225/g.22673  ORF Transcript_12225/g.22673 Transcript_12225/m.22673 type:complete len:435 (+) Transcript_12225:253-1557(+)